MCLCTVFGLKVPCLCQCWEESFPTILCPPQTGEVPWKENLLEVVLPFPPSLLLNNELGCCAWCIFRHVRVSCCYRSESVEKKRVSLNPVTFIRACTSHTLRMVLTPGAALYCNVFSGEFGVGGLHSLALANIHLSGSFEFSDNSFSSFDNVAESHAATNIGFISGGSAIFALTQCLPGSARLVGIHFQPILREALLPSSLSVTHPCLTMRLQECEYQISLLYWGHCKELHEFH